MTPQRYIPHAVSIAGAIAIYMASLMDGLAALAVLLAGALVMMAGAAHVSAASSKVQIWCVAAIIAAVGLAGTPFFEDDYFRYLWDGYRTASVGTPYGIAPEHFFFNPNVPAPFRAVLDHINNPEVATIYGPVLEGFFALGYLIDPANERLLRVFWAVANLALIAALMRKIPAHQVALYAWNPLVLKEVYISGHPDALVALVLCLGWLLSRKRVGLLFGAAIGLAAGIKIVAFAALPLLLRAKRPVFAGCAAAAVFVLAYLPFLASGSGQSEWAGLFVFASRWEFNPSPLFLALRALVGETSAKLSLSLLAMGFAGVMLVRQGWRDHPLPPLHLAFGVILFAAPVINPWYLLWGLAFAVSGRAVWPWVASVALMFSYATGENVGGEALGFAMLDPFTVHPLAYWVQWGLILGAVAFDLRRRPITI